MDRLVAQSPGVAHTPAFEVRAADEATEALARLDGVLGEADVDAETQVVSRRRYLPEDVVLLLTSLLQFEVTRSDLVRPCGSDEAPKRKQDEEERAPYQCCAPAGSALSTAGSSCGRSIETE